MQCYMLYNIMHKLGIIAHILCFQVWKCMDQYCNNKVNCSGYIEVQSGNETALQEAVYSVGPIR